MSSTIDQKSYLQKYLSGPTKDKKKKKKKVVKGKGFKIIDDDIDLSKLRPLDGDELDILDQGEDAPQIAGIVDERPEELRKMEQFKTGSKWRVINEDDGFNSKLQIQEIKKDVKEAEKENEIIFGKMYSDSEDEKQNNDSDLSPPRKSTKKKYNDSDLSPPRKRGQSPRRETKDDSDPSPPRKRGANKERSRKPSRWGDAEIVPTSPKRKESKSNRSSSSDLSPPRKNNFDSDQSPPRKQKPSPQSANKYNKDSRREKDRREVSDRNRNGSERDKKTYRRESPVRSKRESDSDLSPPRRDRHKKCMTKNRSPSPKNRRRKQNTEYDSPRKSRKSRKSPDMKSDSDLSPPRKNRKNTSPINRRDSDSDLSPPRREKDRDRNSKNMVMDRDRSKYRNSDSPPPTNKKMAKTLEGKQAGLQDAKQLREENEQFRRKEDEVFKRLGDDVSGRNAKAVSRKGKRDTSQERQKQREKAERQKELDAKYKLWSKGIKQVEAQEARVQDFIHEASKPLARHKDDKDLEHSLKHVERAGDPMMNYIRERQRERGEIPPEKPSYKGNFPPNRFNIRPGYRWDGVDRSNGYENKYFQQQSKRKAQEEEAYKWSTEDL